MVSISRETSEDTHERLRSVLRAAETVALDGAWAFVESGSEAPPALDLETLAVVRDETSWSALRPVPIDDPPRGIEVFGLFSVHFPFDLDNSGFVGWLATELKRQLGTGVFVVCGSNSARGGIYDYWGYPVQLRNEVLGVLAELGRG